MASVPIDWPEFSFHPVNPTHEVITHSSPENPHWAPLAPGVAFHPLILTDAERRQTDEDLFTRLAQARAHFGAVGLDQAELDAMTR